MPWVPTSINCRSCALPPCPGEQSVIDRMEPVLVGLAGHATEAVERLNAERRHLLSEAYRDALGNLSQSANQVRDLISANLDYAQAREKLDRLDASPSEPVAKLSPAPGAVRVSPKAARTLEQRVQSELLKLPYYGVFDHLAFQVEGDQVRLSGEVSWPLKSDAENAVRRVEGVVGVTSDIQVLPLSPHDNRIRRGAYWAVYGHSALARYRLNPNPPIRIIVAHGNVTLKGVVASEMDKTIAYLRANAVPGVFSVTNHLQVGS